MQQFIRIVYIGLLLVTISSRIQAKFSDEFESPVEFVTISNNASVKFGDGIKSTYFPVIEYSDGWYKPTQIVNYTVYTRERKCQLQLSGISVKLAQIDAEAIWQLNDKRVIIVWNIFELSTRPKSTVLGVKFITKITPVNIETCESSNGILIPWDSSDDENFVKIIPYLNGFDVVSSINRTNSRTRYNLDANQIGQPQSFLFDESVYDVQPASILLHRNLFVISKNRNGYKLMLTKGKGEILKRLLEFETDQLISHFGPANYTICWSKFNNNATTTVDCVQFSEFGVENYRQRQIFLGRKKLLDVENLKHGGFLLFTLNDDGNRLEVTALHPDSGQEISTFELRSAVYSGFKKIVEFDEMNGDVTFAYLHYSNFQTRVILRKYHLSN